MKTMDEQMMTVEQLAELLQVSPRTIYRLLRGGDLPALRIGHNWRFDRRDISRWLFERKLDRMRETA
jgi:excisionase family DNA binding protein